MLTAAIDMRRARVSKRDIRCFVMALLPVRAIVNDEPARNPFEHQRDHHPENHRLLTAASSYDRMGNASLRHSRRNRRWRVMRYGTAIGVLVAVTLLAGAPDALQAQTATSQVTTVGPPPAIDDTIDAAESENDIPERRLTRWNEFDGPLLSIRVGGGVLYDYATYVQDANSKEQIEMTADAKLRDFRTLFRGRLKFKRPTTWSAGIMYDAGNDEWVFRQTGIMVAVPEIWGDIFVGRTKEGFSLNKVMIGYAGWSMERSPMSDASLPILADGVKWLGYAARPRLIWNLGVYGDTLSEGQTFSTYENQVSGRMAWLPVMSPDGGTLLHLGMSGRYGIPKNDTLRLRARPGAWPAPYFVDTAEFAAKSTTMSGVEIYYRPGPWTFGSEYFFQHVDAPESGDPFFHGGEVVMTWMITGETRTYNTRGGYFNQISPARPIYGGGPGAWEIVAHATYVDLDSGTLAGGKYWRITPMLNWYLSDQIRFEVSYGYGSLDRFSLVGKTHFFQTRIQVQL
jgi:phosphate-selective porin OprO/OprP